MLQCVLALNVTALSSGLVKPHWFHKALVELICRTAQLTRESKRTNSSESGRFSVVRVVTAKFFNQLL